MFNFRGIGINLIEQIALTSDYPFYCSNDF